ncbi:aldehyde dehydrogenase family protein [Jiangella asiatica]|uniref:Aldehyde dehydrogenase family protein n=1 Tax=Jiangella asiatica TaxID=2530372 RepID=A0A4R5DBG1_9ACTN|nr:aldehyde dehydrogenase family protein [Jiangella asiatica]TDE09330.1 aldehyde dehydrogenase family protein [Jiangella asiatica]
MKQLRSFVAGDWVDGERTTVARDTYTNEPVAEVHVPGQGQVGEATRAVAAAQAEQQLTAYDRYRILARASELVLERAGELVDSIVTDTGFTTVDARREIDRTAQTLLLSGEEAKRLRGEVVPIDADPAAPARVAFTVRRPVGVVCAITPFNSPLNTVAHKVAPALAAGNGVVLKPALQTPLTADLLLRVLLDAGLPAGLISVLYGDGSTVGQWLLEDEVPAYYAFTGSTAVGEHIQRTIGVRRAQLELGSLASTIICHDADLKRAAQLCVNAAFRKAGQVCTSVQRLYVHESVVDDFTGALRTALDGRGVGDPRDPATFVGPLIDEQAAERVAGWVSTAAEQGAEVIVGGGRTDAVVQPTVLTNVAPDMNVMCREIFGPVVSIRPFTDVDAAIDEANDTPYGLAAGLFTADIGRALHVAGRLRVGTVHVNETSSARVDLMPFGGVKASGYGHEGPAYAIRDMTEETLLTLGP